MKITEATLHDYAVELVNRARMLEQQAETFHRDTNRDKYNHLHGQAFGLRYASEGLAWMLAQAATEQPRMGLWSVKS